MSGTIVTEVHAIQERLKPVSEVHNSVWSNISWPFLPKVSAPVVVSTSAPTRPQLAMKDRREYFLRTASIDRLKQFPAYLCSRSSSVFPNALSYLAETRATLQDATHKITQFLRARFLLISLYLGLVVLSLEMSGLFLAFLVGAKPPGLLFMLASLLVMGVVAGQTINHDSAKARTKQA